MKTTAKKKGGDWVINGSKMWITNGAIADLCICWAMTDDGIRGFIIEKGMKGFSAPEIERKFCLRASVTSALFFDNVVVPESNLLPGVKGLKGPLSCLTQARYGITWGVIGAAQACLAQLIDYTKTREMFGKPLAATQAIQLRLAEMARKITTAQLLSHQLGRLKDQGKMQPPQVSLAKWNNCRMALDIARDCRDMLGGSGISAEYVPIRHALNLESVITYEGTETIHQLTIGRELTGISALRAPPLNVAEAAASVITDYSGRRTGRAFPGTPAVTRSARPGSRATGTSPGRLRPCSVSFRKVNTHAAVMSACVMRLPTSHCETPRSPR